MNVQRGTPTLCGRLCDAQRMSDDNPYGYDPETDTVRVRRQDLGRLLLEFRAELERDAHSRGWSHMLDYDMSFERLADAVDYAQKTAFGWAPDRRMRCNRSEVYVWPDGAPYNGRPVDAVRVRAADTHQEYGSHYVPRSDSRFPRALCGFGFAPEEGKRITGLPTCRECVREHELAAELRPTEPGT